MITDVSMPKDAIGLIVNGRRTVNPLQAMEIVQVSRRTISLWVQLGKVEAIYTAGGQLRIYADSLFRRDPRGRKPHDRHL